MATRRRLTRNGPGMSTVLLATGDPNFHEYLHALSAYGFQCRGGYAKCAEVRDAKRSIRRDGGGPGDLPPPLTMSNR